MNKMHTHTHTHMHTYTHTHTHMCMHVYECVCMCVCMCVYVCVCLCALDLSLCVRFLQICVVCHSYPQRDSLTCATRYISHIHALFAWYDSLTWNVNCKYDVPHYAGGITKTKHSVESLNLWVYCIYWTWSSQLEIANLYTHSLSFSLSLSPFLSFSPSHKRHVWRQISVRSVLLAA